MAPLYHHMTHLGEKIEALENEVRALRQESMEFRPKPETVVAPYTGVPKRPWEGQGLKDRLREMLHSGARGSKSWELTLKWNQLTDEQAIAIAEENPQEAIS